MDMEKVLFSLHRRICNFVLLKSSRSSRQLLEHVLLIASVCSFGALLLLHWSFVVHSVPNAGSSRNCLSVLPGFDRHADVTHLLLNDSGSSSIVTTMGGALIGQPPEPVPAESTCTSILSDSAVDPSQILLSYSSDAGWVQVSPIRSGETLKTQFITISTTDTNCFGEEFLRNLLHYVGPDTVVTNWVLGTFSSGYLYHPHSQTLQTLESKPKRSNIYMEKFHDGLTKLSILIKTSFLFFITTTLVSFTLRETQSRMLVFTLSLQDSYRNHRPIYTLIFTHVIENLVFVPIMVGIIFFLIEFYRGDKFLAFMVLSLVWVCESFSVVSLRTKQGIHFFPRIFYLLFSLFHFYYFSFPFGFSYLALFTSFGFMLHSMLFFWHRYELPAVFLGRVNPEHPRQGVPFTFMGNTSIVTTEQLQIQQQRQLHEENRRSSARDEVFGTARPLETNVHRTTSFSTAASGRISRNSSTTGMFRHGDEDDDHSFLFFMNGEVVAHSNDSRAPSPFDPVPEQQSMNGRVNRLDPPLEPLVASLTSTDDDSRNRSRASTGADASFLANYNGPSMNQHGHEPSTLQTIVNAMADDSSELGNDDGVRSPPSLLIVPSNLGGDSPSYL